MEGGRKEKGKGRAGKGRVGRGRKRQMNNSLLEAMLGLEPTGAHSGVFAPNHLAALWKLAQMLVPGRAGPAHFLVQEGAGAVPSVERGAGLVLAWLLRVSDPVSLRPARASPTPAAGRATRVPRGKRTPWDRSICGCSHCPREHAQSRQPAGNWGPVLCSCQLDGPGERLVGQGRGVERWHGPVPKRGPPDSTPKAPARPAAALLDHSTWFGVRLDHLGAHAQAARWREGARTGLGVRVSWVPLLAVTWS